MLSFESAEASILNHHVPSAKRYVLMLFLPVTAEVLC